MSKVIHVVHKNKYDGSRGIVSFQEGQDMPFASRLVDEKEWFDIVAPAMRKYCLVESRIESQGLTRWEEHTE
jgi:hypothetical protein